MAFIEKQTSNTFESPGYVDKYKILDSPIYVTQPALPDLQEFIPYLEEIWKNKILTNNGPFHQQLEKELAEFLEVPYLSLYIAEQTEPLVAV